MSGGKCEHQTAPCSVDGIAWNGPIGLCDCCHRRFTYLNSGSTSGAFRYWYPNDRCGPCGGKYYETQAISVPVLPAIPYSMGYDVNGNHVISAGEPYTLEDFKANAKELFDKAKAAAHLIPEGTTVFAGPTKKE